ncbi:blastula protease 10-like [Haliotis rubra]|uniref:blastula protease 10-like n=1 Tax=Haliotis rubra TaxID=36100 RepID=UPI001EE52544|nr:blastula protease 10-like [Haliotis rubra]
MRSTFIQSVMSHICLYMMINITRQEGCGEKRTGTYGSVTSPYYPNQYTDFLNCTYIIDAGTTLIRLVFVDIELELDYDVIKVFNAAGSPIVTLTGQESWYVMRPSNYYRLKFTSDMSIRFRGFNATWTIAAVSVKESLHGACGYNETSVRMSSSGLTLGHLGTLTSDTISECMYVCRIDVFCAAFYFVDKNCSLFLNFKGDNIPANILKLM